MEFRLRLLFIFILLILTILTEPLDLIGSHQPVVVLAGDDVILTCYLEPKTDVSFRKVDWTKPGLVPENVHVHQDGRLLYEIQHPSYNLRTRLFMDELVNGNVSMKIFKVKLSDEGKYRCFIPSMQKETFVHLIVGSVSSPVVKMSNSTINTVMLQCESKGWYPEPEVLWLDAEGNLLSAGPTETVRGPDDLYTVSSRVTVEKRHNNTFTCRVQQKNINQTRETHIHVPDEFLTTTSSSSVVNYWLITGVTVGIVFIVATFIHMWIQSKTKINRRRQL